MGKNKYLLIIIVLAVLLVGVSTALVMKSTLSPATPEPTNTNAVVNENGNPNPDNTPEPNINKPAQGAGHDLVPDTSRLYDFPTITVNWLAEGEPVESAAISKELGRTVPTVSEEAAAQEMMGGPPEDPAFVKVGAITSASDKTLIGRNIYHIDTPCGFLSANCINAVAMIDPNKHKIIAFRNYPNRNPTTGPNLDYPLDTVSEINSNIMIPSLETPQQIDLAQEGYSLRTYANGRGMPDKTAAQPVALAADGTRIYINDEKPDITRVRLPNGEFVNYELNIPFYSTERIPAISWADGTQNLFDYSPRTVSGCGGTKLNVQDSNEYAGRLIVGGKTSTGEDVMLLKDPNDKLLNEMYGYWTPYNGYGVDGAEKPSMGTYVTSRPVFFWYDPFGRLIQWTRADAVLQAECAKPVVYLYPTQTERVSVKLGSNIEVKKSEPKYKDGWIVTAQPDGTLTTDKGKKTYPYLYWDGNGASYETPEQGWVVASKDVESFFMKLLPYLGLNAKETFDFNEFWLPIVSKSPYARISFVPQDEWTAAAPLAISPVPDTIIRVFMDWQPLSAPISIEPQDLLPPPERTGFTAVEWGGLLYK
jgi:hypothetical protein